MQPLFQQGSGFGLRLLALALLSIALMVADHRQHHLEQFRGFLIGALSPLQYLANVPAEIADWGIERVTTDRADLRARVAELEAQNLILQARQLQFETLTAENIRLRELLDSTAEREERVLVAELLAIDLDPFRQQIVLNKGTRAGVHRGQPIIDAHGVMGQVIHTGPFTSTALLISDPGHALPVQIVRTGLRTIAQGTGEAERIELLYIPNTADVEEGDLVATSGLGGRFPADYPVARITEFERRPGQAFARVSARPLANLDRSREVLLVWSDDRAAAEELETGDNDPGVPEGTENATGTDGGAAP